MKSFLKFSVSNDLYQVNLLEKGSTIALDFTLAFTPYLMKFIYGTLF